MAATRPLQRSLLLFLIFICSAASAQDMERVRQNLNALCAPEMHGRGYVNNGDKIAAAFIQQQFRQAGLKHFSLNASPQTSGSLPNTNTYFQTFSLPINTIQKTELKLDGRELKPGEDFIPEAGIKSGKGKLKVLPLDTLIYSDEKRGQHFLKQDLHRQALLIPEKFWMKRSILPNDFAQKMQAAGAILISHPQKITHTVSRSQTPQPQFELLQKTLPENPKKLKYEVKAEYHPEYQTQNVIGYVPGKLQPDSFIVFTAHYDHLGRIGKETYFPGANDNASGTSLLLELAHHFARPENQPDYSVAFMAFGAEEAGLVGSRFYVANPLFPLRQIKFLLNLDLAGTGEDGLMVVNGRIHEKEFAQLKKMNLEKRYFPEVKSRGKAANSDHYPFSEKDVPAFFFYTLGGTTAYHDVHDRPETLSLTRFPEYFRMLLDFTQFLMPKR